MAEPAGVVAALAAAGQTVATCESLTAGLVAATIATVPGCSAVLRGGLVTYATELKRDLAGVPAEAIADGVVTRACALAMARGARERCGADWGVATTGVAGPGPADGVPAGRAWLAVVGPRRAGAPGEAGLVEVARRIDVAGDREAVRRACVAEVLGMLADLVAGA